MGFYLCLMDRWEEGLSLINDVITPKTTIYPSDYHLITFLKYFNQKEFNKGLLEARKLNNSNNFHGPFFRCVSYIKLGQYDAARVEQVELLERYPDFMSRGYLYLSQLLVNKEIVGELWGTLLEFLEEHRLVQADPL